MRFKYLFYVPVFFLLVNCDHEVTLKLPSILGDHMVLQQNTQANIWGWANPGMKIKIITGWDEQCYRTTTDQQGNWLVSVKTATAGGPYEISIKADTTIILSDILLGEVWICSGQSNMEWPLSMEESADEEIPGSSNQEIRLFTVRKEISSRPGSNVTGNWSICKQGEVENFSAVGYFFGKNLYQSLEVPIGLINTSWGGTPAEAWTSRETLKEIGDFDQQLAQLEGASVQEFETAKLKKDSIDAMIKLHRSLLNDENSGLSEGWMRSDYNDNGWIESECPAEWSTLPEIGMFEGVVWMRKVIQLPKKWIGKLLVLELGTIDEMDVTYFNGVQVGSSTHISNWEKGRIYDIPETLVSETGNVIAIRVINTVQQGGVIGPTSKLKIYPKGEKGSQPVLLAGRWKYRKAYEFPEIPQLTRPGTPSVLYNGMLHPLKNFNIKGAIWYQGESNVDRAIQYRELFPAMIRDWRNTWKVGDFPFYFVQLAPFRYKLEYTNAELREAQFLTLSKVENTGMAVTLDIGNPNDIHPTNKRDVGKRLALWALAKDYGQNVVYSGPLYRELKIEGNRIRILFDHTGSGLMAVNGTLTHFEIAGADQIYRPANTIIDGETVLVSNREIRTPVAVRYGWGNTDEPNLFNKEGFPASSFCSDEWTRVTDGKK